METFKVYCLDSQDDLQELGRNIISLTRDCGRIDTTSDNNDDVEIRSYQSCIDIYTYYNIYMKHDKGTIFRIEKFSYKTDYTAKECEYIYLEED